VVGGRSTRLVESLHGSGLRDVRIGRLTPLITFDDLSVIEKHRGATVMAGSGFARILVVERTLGREHGSAPNRPRFEAEW
jgi:hypothetical protein